MNESNSCETLNFNELQWNTMNYQLMREIIKLNEKAMIESQFHQNQPNFTYSQ
jgi:hypothetical protein